MTEEAVAGRRILIVEDEFFVADSLSMYLESLEAVVVGPVASVGAALDLIAATERLDGAVLDVNLRGERAFPVAEALTARGVPVVLVTGYGAEAIPEEFSSIPRCTKPFKLDELVLLLCR